MTFSNVFITRPVATVLMSIGIALVGILALYFLPIAPLPQVEFPTIIVQSTLPGASPEIMASSIATPLERQLSRISGITQMTSSNTQGLTKIVIQFDLSRNINGAARDVQAAINAAGNYLPSNLPNRPSYRKVNPADAPFMVLALTSDKYKVEEVYDIASNILQQKISQVEGVGLALVGGGSIPSIRVEANPLILNKLQIGMVDIASAIKNANVNMALGQLRSDQNSISIAMNDDFKAVQDYSDIIIKYQNNKPIRIGDVAEVVDSMQDVRNAGILDSGKPAIAVIIFKEPGANVIKTVSHIKQVIRDLDDSIPNGIKTEVILDGSQTIKASVFDAALTLVASVVFIMIIIYLFLNNFTATLIPSAAMVLSILGTFAVMYLCGFSINNLSLMALIISSGFVIDDAIVVVENISRQIRDKNVPRLQAAILGMREISSTIISISLSLIAVFIPILYMSGIIGRLLHEFAVTLAVAILISLFVSLTLTPMMCASSKAFEQSKHQKLSHSQRFFAWLNHKYHLSLIWALSHSTFMQLLTVGIIILNVFLYTVIPKGFLPQQDTGRITASIVADQKASFQSLRGKLTQYLDIIQHDPAVEHTFGYVGSSSTNSGSLLIMLKDLSKRKDSADQVIARLRFKLMKIGGVSLYMQAAQDLVIGGRQGNAQFQYTVSSNDITQVNQYAQIIMNKLKNITSITDINSDQRDKGKRVYIKINYDAAARHNVSIKSIDDTLYLSFGQSLSSIIYQELNQYYVVLEVAPKFWQNPEVLNQIYIPSTSGSYVPLSNLASFETSDTLLAINHQGLSPAVTLSFNLAINHALGDAIDVIEQEVKELNLPLGVQTDFQGVAQALKKSLSDQLFLILITIVTVYIILGILYESLIHPITILSTLPSAGLGALFALLITGNELNLVGLVGIILLIGIVKKNAIMIVDFALEHKQNDPNSSPHDNIIQASILRFRPIIMTTLTAVLGALPLILNADVGSELRRPLGISIIGGLILSQLITLYTVPVIYLGMENFSAKIIKLKSNFSRRMS